MIQVNRVQGAPSAADATLAARARAWRFPIAHAERVTFSEEARRGGARSAPVQVADVRWYRAIGYAHVLRQAAAGSPRRPAEAGDGAEGRGAPGDVAPAGRASPGPAPAEEAPRERRPPAGPRTHRAAAAYLRAMDLGGRTPGSAAHPAAATTGPAPGS